MLAPVGLAASVMTAGLHTSLLPNIVSLTIVMSLIFFSLSRAPAPASESSSLHTRRLDLPNPQARSGLALQRGSWSPACCSPRLSGRATPPHSPRAPPPARAVGRMLLEGALRVSFSREQDLRAVLREVGGLGSF